ALHGDSVDNIPGVAGVGEKTAGQILSVCKNVEDFTHVDFRERVRFTRQNEILRRIPGKIEDVLHSRNLHTPCYAVPDAMYTTTVVSRQTYRRSQLHRLQDYLLTMRFHSHYIRYPVDSANVVIILALHEVRGLKPCNMRNLREVIDHRGHLNFFKY